MTRKKTQFAAISHAVTSTQSQEAARKIAAFTQGGRADSALPAVAPAPSMKKRGRPALTEETKRTILALRKSDVQQLEELALRWKRQSDGLVSLKTTMVMRSLLATALPLLEGLEAVEDEAHLRQELSALFELA